jgi:Bacteriophage Sf6, terminase small subunit-like
MATPGRRRGPKRAEGPREPSGRKQRPRKEPDRPQRPDVKVTDEIMREIIDRMADGESLKAICDGEGFPTTRAINQFCWRNPLWHSAFENAKLRQQDAMIAKAYDIASDRSRDYDAKGNAQYHVVQRDKLIVDTIMKTAALINPLKYGTTRNETKIVGDAARPVVIRTLDHPQTPRWLREAEEELGLPLLEGAPNAERLRNLLLAEQPLTPDVYEIAASQREETANDE